MTERRTAIVTGSTGGIGLGVAEALAGAGMNVMLNGFGDPAEIEAIRAGLAARHGGDVAYSAADMSRPAEIAAMVAQCRDRFGRIDVVVNNASVQTVAPIEDFPP